ncbi:alpha-amylase family glycosyl hydrolase [Lacrimispora saccharolytica]|uniref:Alpha amylase catalytic region n=1 Tax=Lacrimispora saccharolytica (strain ATCC 35040 / DSM 2544 / NRCC 2533 / WM1) TaxID=610130 RepID=D9R2K3_LACSW|nr:alpha-amylase family glycosyl hydrolase [Lacrimispora saccharolytica]ADL06627.1 alpha amylase catalytic region [[Clostridium] saccharolyticum WM1]QRV19300.1 alpha-amylase [Lacrimispora saccharolytica]
MEQYKIAKHEMVAYPMGLSKVSGGIRFCVAAKGENCKVHIFKAGAEEPDQTLSFPAEFRKGDVWNMTVLGKNFEGLEYCFEIDGKLFSDPYGKCFTGRETWGDLEHASALLRTPVKGTDFDWEGDRSPQIPYEDSIIYRLHNRGFTKHASSKVKNKGTFDAIEEKIPYLKELGVTAVELMPVNEFSEVIMVEYVHGDPAGVDKPSGKLNYWGYTAGCYFAPKASYAAGNDPVLEFKSLVKALHKEGLEVIVELYFTGKEPPSFVLDAVRFWADEYHVDGIHLVGEIPLELLGRDPYLSRIKLLAVSWEPVSEGTARHLGEYNDGFLIDMRRVLKGDEEQMKNLAFRTRRNPAGYGIINYMANTNGFPMMDMVSYDTRHNEGNGENNQDGNPYNYSWNCGVEGPTKRKKVMELRKKQLRNAFLLLFLSQGTPLIMAGDEFGNSQSGNNNAYCQDNEVSWLNWNLVRTNQDILDFVKAVIAFRKAHPVFHMPKEPRIMDYLACGFPDVSYHGVKAWCPEFDNFRRQLGIFYWGEYGKKPDGTHDNNFFVAYNMHWEPHEFDLPNLPKKERWHVVFHTDKTVENGMYPEGKEPAAEGKRFLVPSRSIVVFMGKNN